jgi:hypothetical protein
VAVVAALCGGCGTEPAQCGGCGTGPAQCGGCGTEPAQCGGCGTGPAQLRVGQSWTAPPGWRVTATGQLCGPATTPVEPDVADVCRVAVTVVNDSDRAQPIAGTDARPGPFWRMVGYDADSHEFHGHGRPEPDAPPGSTTTIEVVFEVPAGRQLRRVLLGDTMVRL